MRRAAKSIIWAAKTAKIQLFQNNQSCHKINQRFHAVSQRIHAFNQPTRKLIIQLKQSINQVGI